MMRAERARVNRADELPDAFPGWADVAGVSAATPDRHA